MSQIHLKLSGYIAEITIDNASKANCLTSSMLSELNRHIDVVEREADCRALILSATGDKFFCSGADIASWGDLSPKDFARRWVIDGHRLFDRISQLAIPTIGVLNGHAFGGGLELISTCDIRISHQRALLALPEASVGVVPGWSGTQRLARLLPESILKEMALFGNKLTAERAHALGFINTLSEEPLVEAYKLTESLPSLSPRSIEINKRMIHAAVGENPNAMIESLGSAAISASEDRIEGVTAFLEKRAPRFNGY